tara:strand:+ start:9058 stop:9297 length:240 start_codon:yes stop_codon:yes gene_type:complete
VGQKFDFECSTFGRDEILEMSSDELQQHIFKFKRKIREATRMGRDTTELEVEYCYLDHERQMRMRSEKFSKKKRREGGR